MVLKTVIMLMVYFVPLIVINLGLVSNIYWLFGLYLTSGFGMAGIGMGVMHDAIHGSYSSNKRNNIRLGYTMNLIGANATVWKIQHNVLHHAYPNIDQADDDINPPLVLRFSPHARKYWLHRFQHLYVWFFYGLSTLSWVTTKDFIRLNRYRKMGFFRNDKDYNYELLRMVGWKLFYYSYTLILPMIIVPLAWWIILLAFISMHFLAGIYMSLVFQTAHIMPGAEYPLPDRNGQMANDWATHQMATTTNYSPQSKYFSWLIGGLNYQIEHHLLPDVCHIHYKKLSHLVSETAEEFGIPYNTKQNFVTAIRDHAKMLQQLGS